MKVLMATPASGSASHLCMLLGEAGYDVQWLPTPDTLMDCPVDPATRLVVAGPLGCGCGPDSPHLQRHAQHGGIPVLYLAQGTGPDECIAALRAGADDAVPGGTTGGQFLMQVRRLAEGRRAIVRQVDGPLVHGAYELDPVHQCARRLGTRVSLTPREFQMAWILFSHLDRLVTRELLLARIWASFDAPALRSLRSHVHRVRLALDIGPATGLMLRTVYSGGYRLEWVGDLLRAPILSAAHTPGS